MTTRWMVLPLFLVACATPRGPEASRTPASSCAKSNETISERIVSTCGYKDDNVGFMACVQTQWFALRKAIPTGCEAEAVAACTSACTQTQRTNGNDTSECTERACPLER